MYPLCYFSARLDFSTNSCGILEIFIMMYLSHSIWLFKYKYFTSMHMYLDVMSDIMLFTWIFMVVKSEVGVLTSPG